MTRKFVKRSKFFAIFPDPNLLDFALAKPLKNTTFLQKILFKNVFLINFFK